MNAAFRSGTRILGSTLAWPQGLNSLSNPKKQMISKGAQIFEPQAAPDDIRTSEKLKTINNKTSPIFKKNHPDHISAATRNSFGVMANILC